MTLLFMDSFDHYTEDQLERKWFSQSGGSGTAILAGGGRRGTSAWQQSNYNGSWTPFLRSKVLVSGGVSTIIAGVAVYINTFQTGNGYKFHPFHFRDEAGAIQLSLSVTNTTNYLCARLAGGSTIIAEGTTPITPLKWWYLEIKAYIHDTAGTVEIKANGVTEASETSVDTKGSGSYSTIDHFFLYHNTYVGDVRYDDLYICDNTGTSNNDFLGDIKVETLFPDGAGTSTDWTPSTGSNYQCVDENPATDDTDYISETTASDHDTYAYPDLATASGTVYGTQQLLLARKDDAGSRSINSVVRSGTTDYTNSQDYALSDSYTYTRDILEEDPDTATAWTISGINSAEFGVELGS